MAERSLVLVLVHVSGSSRAPNTGSTPRYPGGVTSNSPGSSEAPPRAGRPVSRQRRVSEDFRTADLGALALALAGWIAPGRAISTSRGSAVHTSHLPTAETPVGSHLPALVDTRQEMFRANSIYAITTESRHGDRYGRLDYVVLPHLSQACISVTIPLTRASLDSSFATDSCVHKAEAIRPSPILLGGRLGSEWRAQASNISVTSPTSQRLSQPR